LLFKTARVNPASYYKWLNRPPKDNGREILVLKHFRLHHGKQGIHKLKQSLQYECSRIINHKVIRRILRFNGLTCVIRRAKQKKEADNLIAKENILNRNFKPDRPNTSLATDFTYLNVNGNTYYLSVVLDLFDNNPLVWYLTDKSDKSLSLNTIDLLKKQIDLKGCLIHSDQGIQYSCKAYCERLAQEGVIQSMSRRGNCWDNAVIENFFGIIKTESIYMQPARTRSLESLKELLAEEFDYYANYRPQAALGGIPPNAYRKLHCPS
jgi:transposase InsO family protein